VPVQPVKAHGAQRNTAKLGFF
jgi:hypothetical protein